MPMQRHAKSCSTPDEEKPHVSSAITTLQLLLGASQISLSTELLAELGTREEERASSNKNLAGRKEVCARSKEIPRVGGLCLLLLLPSSLTPGGSRRSRTYLALQLFIERDTGTFTNRQAEKKKIKIKKSLPFCTV